MKLKKVMLGVTAMLVYSTAFAQIPVTDAASIGQQISAQVETLAKWKL